MPGQVIQLQLGNWLVPFMIYPRSEQPPGFLSIEAREIESGITRAQYIRSQERRKISVQTEPSEKSESEEEFTEEAEAEEDNEAERWLQKEKETRITFDPTEAFPQHLKTPQNVGIMCRVARGTYGEGNEALRTFKEIYTRFNNRHRAWLYPYTVLRDKGVRIPSEDPLATQSRDFKPWLWEGCIPTLISAAINPEILGLQNRMPLNLAIPRTSGKYVESWGETVKLIQQSFERAKAGGFYFGERKPENWIPYSCLLVDAIRFEEYGSLSIKEAGRILQIYMATPSRASLKFIETQYNTLYEAVNPANVEAEANPGLFEQRTRQARMIQDAYYRLLLERLIAGRILCYDFERYPSRKESIEKEHRLAEIVLSMLCTLDRLKLRQGLVRIVWKKDAPRRFKLWSSTVNFIQNDEGEFELDHVKETIAKWIHKLYIEPYPTEKYDFKTDVEGLLEV